MLCDFSTVPVLDDNTSDHVMSCKIWSYKLLDITSIDQEADNSISVSKLRSSALYLRYNDDNVGRGPPKSLTFRRWISSVHQKLVFATKSLSAAVIVRCRDARLS